ncbi:hypothetical protein OKA04_20800 [Luteolibacter flavescens]|uniref:Uncharacterized protein n=1 Tax=Luteolibacter flavescens TaxID=1859460 RepID=A0ABT3FUF1_9BACT|nr:hypothetical protein [Luteolibacter flavescens]MCW1887190.1 hypothetical protein [Luteolibacter flavescens]
MRTLACLILSAGLAAGAQKLPLPLPEWEAADKAALEKGEFVPGLMLLGMDAEEEDAAANPPDVPQPTAEELAEKEKASTEVAEEYLEEYFGERPSTFIVDPQGLLSSKDERDRESFLKYHSSDSEVDLYVYLFDGHQVIPSEVREEEIVERFFSEGKPAVVVYYFLGAPQKSDIYVSPQLSDAVPAVEQRRALISSVEEALEKPDALAQLEAFCVQLSIRIYWMERAAGLVTESASSPLPRRARSQEPAVKPEPAMLVQAKEWSAQYGQMAGVMGGAVLILAGVFAFARSRTRHRFPVFEVAPRLGGAHAAGIGAVISFGSTTQSPSSQRNDVPDYLGL